MFLTIISEIIPSLWISVVLLGIFVSSIYFISKPSPIISKHCCCPHPTWKRPKRWRRCKLHYWIARRCRHQPKNRPTCLYGSFFSSPYCVKHRRWRRGRARSKAFFKSRRMDEFFIGRKDVYHPWESEGVSKNARDSFCDKENLDFLQPHILLSSFHKPDHVANFDGLTQRANLSHGQIL